MSKNYTLLHESQGNPANTVCDQNVVPKKVFPELYDFHPKFIFAGMDTFRIDLLLPFGLAIGSQLSWQGYGSICIHQL